MRHLPFGASEDKSSTASAARIVGARYRLDQRLGEGTSGIVWKALHLALGKSFALKLLHPEVAADDTSRARFEREASVLGRLQHPNVVSITDFGFDGTDGGTPFLVAEIVEGASLAEILREEGPLPWARAFPILRGVASALDAAHAAGVVHRDIKPQNILLERGEGTVPRVLDFGIASFRAEGRGSRSDAPPGDQPQLTDRGALPGTPLYIAPELIRQPTATAASDVYSLGVVAYELLAGRPPFTGSTAEILRGHLEQAPPPPRAKVPDEAWEVLRSALDKDPARRPAGAGRFVQLLEEAFSRSQKREQNRRVRRRGWWLSATLAVLSWLLTEVPPVAARVRKLEQATRDWRLRHSTVRAPDPRIVLVTLEDALPGNSGSLADAGDAMGAGLESLFRAGARGVALDLVLPPKWAESSVFSDVVVRHADRLVLAAQATADGTLAGMECVAGLTTVALGADRAAALFGLVNVLEDDDGVTRRARLFYTDGQHLERPLWAAAAARLLQPLAPSPRETNEFRIDTRTDPGELTRMRWSDLETRLAGEPSVVRDRLVLVGADFRASGEDMHRLPGREGQQNVSGLVVQAVVVDTILGGRPLRPAPPSPFLAAFLLVAMLTAAGLLITGRQRVISAVLSAALVAYAWGALRAADSSGVWWPMAQTVGLLAVAFGGALATKTWARAENGADSVIGEGKDRR